MTTMTLPAGGQSIRLPPGMNITQFQNLLNGLSPSITLQGVKIISRRTIIIGLFWPTEVADGTVDGSYMASVASQLTGESYGSVPREYWGDLESIARENSSVFGEVPEIFDWGKSTTYPESSTLTDEQKQIVLNMIAAGAGATAISNTRIEPNDEEATCNVGKYKDVKKNCNGHAHHIIPDRSFSLGARGSGDRIPNMPRLDEGMAICLDTVQHGIAHAAADPLLQALGKLSSPSGSLDFNTVSEISREAAIAAKKECATMINNAIAEQKAKYGQGNPQLRTKWHTPTKGSPLYNALKYQQTR